MAATSHSKSGGSDGERHHLTGDCKICPICQEASSNPHQIHYGGLACFSCRAFFRRAHQKTRNPNFACKKGNKCVVNVKTRRRCQKCRYELCLQNGMKPEAVLTDVQKKVRFRYALRKKASRRTESSAISREFIDDDDDDEEEETLHYRDSGMDTTDPDPRYTASSSPLAKKQRIDQEGEPEIKMEDFTSEESLDGEPPSGPHSFLMTGVGDPGCQIGIRQVEKVLACFILTCGQMVADACFKVELLSYHQGVGLLSRNSFLTNLTSLATQFRHFALMHQEFLRLPKSDQRKLLSRNTPLFIQYVIARYITGETGYEQIGWLLGYHTPSVSLDEQETLMKISIQRLDKDLQMFKNGHLLDPYLEFAKRLHLKAIQYKCLSFLGHSILFQHDNTMTFEAPDLVRFFCEDALKMCPHSAMYFGCQDRPNVQGIVFTLEAMAKMFAQNFLWIDPEFIKTHESDSDSLSGSNPSSPSISGEIVSWTPRYSADEEGWLTERLNQINGITSKVCFEEDLINEYIMHVFIDEPLSKHFMPKSFKVISERYRWVMKMHPEFQNLSGKQQMKLWERNSHYGAALCVAKLEACDTGTQQSMFIMGKIDRKMFDEAKINIGGKEPKKLTMAATNRYTGILTESLMENFDRLVKSIGSVIKDDTTFKMLILALLFSDIDSEEMPELERLQKSYLGIVRRRCRDLVEPNRDSESNLALGNFMYSKFNSCVCDVKELSMIVRKLQSMDLNLT